MSKVPPEISPSGPIISLQNLSFHYPEADLILRSRDSYEFRVLKLYIIHSSPVLGEMVSTSPNPQPGDPANPAVSEVEESTGTDVLPVVQLLVDGAILFSLLTYIFPVPPVLPSTVEQTMELLSVAQEYKMDIVLTHIRNHISQQDPSFIRRDTAFLVYSLAQTYRLRTEMLQAARSTLSFSNLTIRDLASEDKLDIMSGTSLHELWKYHTRVRSNLTSDLDEFRASLARGTLGDSRCGSLTDSGLPHWIDDYIATIGTCSCPAFLDLTEFHMDLAKHIQSQSHNGGDGCASCADIPCEKIRTFWEALTAVVRGSIAKVRVANGAMSGKGPEYVHRLNQISCSSSREQVLRVKLDHLLKPPLHRSIRICPMRILSSNLPTLSISESIDRR